MLNPKELEKTRIHLFGQDPISEKYFNPPLPITDSDWLKSPDSFYKTLQCPRAIGSCPAKDIAEIIESSPTAGASLLSLQFILTQSNYEDFSWDNPKNPKIGKDNLDPTYNMALQIIGALASHQKLWAGAMPNTRYTATWKTYRDLPKEDKNPLPKDLQPKLVSPTQITLLLKGKPKAINSVADFQAELYVFEDVGLEIFGRKYHLNDIPFICPRVGEDEICGLTNYEGPLLIANQSYYKLLKDNPKEAENIYRKARETLFVYKTQDYDQNEYNITDFDNDYPYSINLLINAGLAIKNKIKKTEQTISQAIAELIKSTMPDSHINISEDCENTKNLKINDFQWNPEEGLQLKATLKIKNQEKNIEISKGTTRVYSK